MKISNLAYKALEDAIQKSLTIRGRTLAGLWDEYSANGHSHERFRWDLFWMANGDNSNRLYNLLYKTQNLSDVHVDTALRNITHAGDIDHG